MEIKYLGHSSFKLSNSQAKLITDPFDPTIVGLKLPSVEADIVTISHGHDDHNKIELILGDPLVLDIAGEYEKKGIRVTGFDSFHDNTKGSERGKNIIFKIEIDDVSVLHCGDLGHALTSELVEEIGAVDVLIVPVGGYYTIGAVEAVAVVRAVEPSIVIPMHYKHDKLNQQTFEKLEGVDSFLSAIGAQNTEPVKNLNVKRGDLDMQDGTKVVVLEI